MHRCRMTRLTPLFILMVVLAVSGVWLTRERAATGTAGAFADLASSPTLSSQSGQVDGEPLAQSPGAPADEPGSAGSPSGNPSEAEIDSDLVPEGFSPMPPMVEERRTSFERAEEVLEPALDYAAVIETNRGVIVIDLFQDETPVTVNNFVFLALQRYFDGIVFHRVLEDFMAQTGDPTGTGTGGPGYRFDDEIVDGLSHDGRGVVSMANSGPGTNGSQFFITFTATPWLDGNHTVFGQVIDGDEVLDALRRIDPSSQDPSAAALLDAPAASVREQGVPLEGDGTVSEALEETLGAVPVAGQSFEAAGYRGVIGTMQGEPAAGFFAFPDVMERVTVVTRTR